MDPKCFLQALLDTDWLWVFLFISYSISFKFTAKLKSNPKPNEQMDYFERLAYCLWFALHHFFVLFSFLFAKIIVYALVSLFLVVLFMKSQSNWHVNVKHGFFLLPLLLIPFCFLFFFLPFLFSVFLSAVILCVSTFSARLLFSTSRLYMFCFHLDYNVRAKIMTYRNPNTYTRSICRR